MGKNIFGIQSTFDAHNIAHQTIEWSDPALLPKRKTTHDEAAEGLTQDYTAVDVDSDRTE